MPRACLALCLALAVACGLRASVSPAASDRALGEGIARYRAETWQWQQVMSVPPTRAATAATPATLGFWKARAEQAQRLAQHPPHLRQFLCIHRFEGSWTDGGAPYYGGLQMDLDFMRAYGARLLARKGTADRWTPLEQIWVAERALRSGTGFFPWPNTARFCGLIH